MKNAASQGRWIALATYLHDERGDLAVVADAEGHQTRYTYDEHRLVSTAHPNGVTFHYRYDAAGRCVETWGSLPEGDEGYLVPGISKMLADGTTVTRGIYHCQFTYGTDGYVEIVDLREAPAGLCRSEWPAREDRGRPGRVLANLR
ncbi:hypothetical protein [Sorangium sp. So ce341]|uniref:hypothetical protein n=1 Tax=Sorangium sp. So ce341 TaxID=3133302 RepID=UPI003F5FCC60